MAQTNKTPVAILLASPQTERLLRLFSLPEFVEKFLPTVVDIRTIKLSLFSRLKARGHRVLHAVETADWQERALCEHIVKEYLGKIELVVGLDSQISILDRLSRHPSGSKRCFAIQMGSHPRFYERDIVRDRPTKVTLLSWGSREYNNYSRNGLYPEHIIAVGSLMRALADRQNSAARVTQDPYDLCIVSQFRPVPDPSINVSDSAHAESQTMPALLEVFEPAIKKLNLKVVVALRAQKFLATSIKAGDEKLCFEQNLDAPFTFTASGDLYSSYSAVLQSRISVGRNSSLLFECMASSSRIIFVNPTLRTEFNPPSDWPYGYVRPSAEDIESILKMLLNMSKEQYSFSTKKIAAKYCEHEIDTLSNIAQLLSVS